MLVIAGGAKFGEESTAQAAGGDTGSFRFKLELALARLATARYHDVESGRAGCAPRMHGHAGWEMHTFTTNLSLADASAGLAT
jgi:hypothetical protein